MASQQPRTVQPPPELPSMPEVSSTLTNYLRQFSLWCRHGFADKISASTSQPGLMLQAYDAPSGSTPKVFMIQVKSDGTIVATPMALGGGRP
ncbi:MAG TPA: hypothetical protein VFW22_07875 [Pseudolabrys sp.]|nr:hypothetical protein [Pseudolabrys sp.]